MHGHGWTCDDHHLLRTTFYNIYIYIEGNKGFFNKIIGRKRIAWVPPRSAVDLEIVALRLWKGCQEYSPRSAVDFAVIASGFGRNAESRVLWQVAVIILLYYPHYDLMFSPHFEG